MAEGMSAIYILTNRGESLISRIFRNDISVNAVDTFRLHVVVENEVRSPINSTRDATFFHVTCNSLIFMAASKGNPNAAVVFEFLSSMIKTFTEYFGKLTSTNILENSSVCYELIDEMLDFGFPQIVQANKLRAFIKGEEKSKGKEEEQRKTLTQELTGQNTFRPPNLRYKKNQIYIDVIENINLLLSKEGQKLSQDAVGVIQLKTQLSGNPTCKFGFNDSIQLREAGVRGRSPQSGQAASKNSRSEVAIDDVTCHQCVKLHAFEKSRVIQFTPPDGEFDLMNYRVTSNLKMPFNVSAIVNEIGGTKVDYRVSVQSNYNPSVEGKKVVINIPVPPNTAQHKVKVRVGKVNYDPTNNVFRWVIKKFPGRQAYDLTASVSLMSTLNKKTWSRPPISMQFEVPSTASGLRVRFLRVEESKLGYSTIKWVRYLSRAANYQIRIN